MKKIIGRRALSWALTLALVLSLVPMTAIPAHAAGAATVRTWTELQSSISGGATSITLAADIVVPAATDTTTNAALKLTYNVTIDGGRHTISVEHPYVEEDGRLCANPTKGGVFYIDNSATVTIKNVTIMGGQVTDSNSKWQAAIQVNKGYLTLEYVTLTRSNRGLAVNEDGRAVLKQCNVVRNVALASGGGIAVAKWASLVLDSCSVSENRAYGEGGACYDSAGGWIYANNTVFANNWADSVGGVFNAGSSGYHYLINCTLVGNVSADNGGAIATKSTSGNFKAANCIILDNRVIKTDRNGTTNEANDIYLGSSYSGEKIRLFYCLYGTVTKSSDDQSFENVSSKTGTVQTFASTYRTDGILSLIREGSSSKGYTYKTGVTANFPHPALVKMNVSGASNTGVYCIPIASNGGAHTGGTTTYFNYSITGSNSGTTDTFGYMSYSKNSTATAMTSNSGSSTKVGTFITGSNRTNGVIGACGTSTSTYYTVKLSPDLLSSGLTGGTVSGATFYGESYVSNTQVAVTATPANSGDVVIWSDDLGYTSTDNPYRFAVGRNVSLTPRFVTPCTVTFNANGGSVNEGSRTVTNGTAVGALPTPTRTGYTSDGWYTAASGGTKITTSTVVSSDVTYYAHWTPTNYTITYNLNGGSVATANPTSYTIETATFTLNNPTKSGCTFNGWTGSNGTTPQTSVSVTNGSTGNKTYTANWTQIPASVTTAPTANTLTYNGAAQTLVSTGAASNGTMQYRLGTNGAWSNSQPTATNAGNYSVYYKVVGTNGYGDSAESGPVNVTIEQKTISAVTWGNTSFTYNGEAQAPTATAEGLVNGDTCAVTVTGAAQDAGTHTATVTGLSNANYKLPSGTIATEFTIAKAPLTVTADNVSVTYGDAVPAYTASFSGLKGSYSITPSFSCEYTPASGVGSYPITPSVASDNYNITCVNGTLTVEPKEIGISWGGTSFTYDGSSHTPEAAATGALNGDALTLTVAGAQTNAGTYTATVTEINGTNSENYKLPADVTADFTIAQAAIDMSSVTWVYSGTAFIYDGTEKTIVLTNLPDGVSVVSYSGNSATDASDYTASAILTYIDTENYITPTVGTCAWTISPKNITGAAITLGGDLTYTGAALTKSVRSVVIDGLNATYDVTGNTNTNAGDYSLTVSGTGNFTGTATADWSILPRDITGANITLGAALTYDGGVQTQTVTRVTAGGVDVTTYTISGNTGTDAGDYVLTVNGSGNFISFATADWSIAKKSVAGASITLDGAALTYSGTAQTKGIESVTISGLTPTYDVTGNTQTNAGSYELTIHGTGNFTGEQAAPWSIAKQTVTVSGISAVDRAYDGTTRATLDYRSMTITGKHGADDVTVTASGAFADKSVGANKTVTISGLTLVGAKAGNYQLNSSGQQVETTADITKKEITVSGITAENKVYDGNTSATLKYDGVTLTGKIDGEMLGVTATGAFESAAKGTGKTVMITDLTLTGADVENYILAMSGQQSTTTANITGAATSVTTIPTANAITYGQTLASSTLTGGVGSVDGTFSWTVPTTAPAVSDSGVTEYDVTFTPTDAENYAPSTCKIKLTVSKATPTIATKPTASEIGYGQTLADSPLVGGAAENPYNHAVVAGTFAWTTSTTAPAKTDSNSTEYSVTFTPTDTTNYNSTTTAVTLTVNKAVLSPAPTLTMAGYTYGDTPSTPSVSNNPENTTVTYYYSTVSFLSSDPNKMAPNTGRVWTEISNTTLNAGTYFMRAVLAESANYAQYVTAQTAFTVSQAQYAAPTAPTVSGYTVTINAADQGKRLEYAVVTSGSAAPTAFVPVPTLSASGTFTLSGLAKETGYTIYLRERASANGNYKASAAVNTSWTTPTEWTVVYNANRGTGTVPATQNGTGTTAVTVASGSGLTRTGYAFNGWNTKADGSGTAYSVGASINTGATLYAQWTANSYTVKFNANGGTGTIADESFTYDTAQALTANAFSRTGYTFAGWSTSAGGPVLYGNSQSVKNLTVSGDVTLYAVWAQDTYVITGTITSETDGNVTLKLMQGNTQFGTTQTVTISNGSGSYKFTGVPAGTYNLVAVQGDQTVTALIVITNAGVTQNITMPSHKVNSVLKVEGGDTPPVVVGGLDVEAASKAEESKTVTITMTIEKQEEQQLPETATEVEQETQEAIKAIESAASGSDGVEYMNITVEKKVVSDNTTETETLTATNTVMEIVIPYDMDGKKNITIYRHHDGTAAALTQNDNKTDGTYQVDAANGLIYLYADQFSTYAIAYEEEVGSNPVTPPTPPTPSTPHTPSSPSGGGTSYYTITVTDTEGGAVAADRKTASRGTTVTLTVTADNGFQLASLTVTDAARNKISLTQTGGKYTFSMPSSNVTVTAAFAPESCAQDDTCPISAFTDADPKAWYHDGVHYVLENGIMNGYGNGLFGPNDNTSRAMMAQILWNMEGNPVVNYALSYSDVEADKWYVEAIRWATAEDIMNGYGGGLFGPDDAMTREQLVTIVHRYAKYKGLDVSATSDLLGYTDADKVSEWALASMKWAVGSGAVLGRTDTTLNPKDTATRAEIATIIMRYCTEIAE